MSLRHLPYEIVFYVAQQLDLEDVYNLSLTCRQFQYLAKEDNICKAVLEVRFRKLDAHWQIHSYTLVQDSANDVRRSQRRLRLPKQRRRELRSATRLH